MGLALVVCQNKVCGEFVDLKKARFVNGKGYCELCYKNVAKAHSERVLSGEVKVAPKKRRRRKKK